MQKERDAARAVARIQAIADARKDRDPWYAIFALLVDLRHFAEAHGVSFEEAVGDSLETYQHEREEEK